MTICDTCRGEVYPRQCRNSAAWRRRHGGPADCPHGLALDNLPIGDNRPAGAPYRGPGSGRCEHLTIVPHGCCDHERICGRKDRTVTRKECEVCSG